jgi:hypothetical protein
MTAATEPSTASGSATSGSGTRKSVPLTAQDLADLAVLRSERSALGRSLTRLSGIDPRDSDAAVLHGLVALGLQLIKEAAEEAGYAELADSYVADPDERAAREAGRRHRARGARARSVDQ